MKIIRLPNGDWFCPSCDYINTHNACRCDNCGHDIEDDEKETE